MTVEKGERTYQCKALTDLWTGSVDRKAKRLVTTGLLGSIRWWFEVLVRGLRGGACDASDTKCEDRNHCVVCEFFGCTGWGRKSRFDVLDENNQPKAIQIKKDTTFCLRFTPLRPIRREEWALLDATLHLIAEYGAIGGRTVLKPSDEPNRAGEEHHKDFGLMEIIQAPQFNRIVLDALKKYVSQWRKVADGDFAWASIENFWYVNGKHLGRTTASDSSFNIVLRRKESKACRECGGIHNPPRKCPKTKRYPSRYSELLVNNNKIERWLAGSQQESKKVFSFKNPARTFGFVKPGLIDFTAMKQKLENPNVWGKNGWDFLTGDEIINQLFVDKEDRP
ncbi:MAG: type III-B CRISPR module RAMP protein Cmr1 [Deltaproteobacteria bacterium]|nr:type III-B CRISPR module RAMP protein Cmr1 [Deltaproteobacteria bacterium]MBW2330022.1 type III-B CRISPR module RAMP protein Cmr1 [Deltaproteobacteria bacterium]